MNFSTRLFLTLSNVTMVFGLTPSKNARGRPTHHSGNPHSGSGNRQDSPSSAEQNAKTPSKHPHSRRHGGDSTHNPSPKSMVPYSTRATERDNPEETDAYTGGANACKDLVPSTKEVARTQKVSATRPSTSRTSTGRELVVASKEVAQTEKGPRNPSRTKHHEQRQIEHSTKPKCDRRLGWTRPRLQATSSSKSGKGLSAERSSVACRRTSSSVVKGAPVPDNQVPEETYDDQRPIEDRISEVNDDVSEPPPNEPPTIKPTVAREVLTKPTGSYPPRNPDSPIVGRPLGEPSSYSRPPMRIVNRPLGYGTDEDD